MAQKIQEAAETFNKSHLSSVICLLLSVLLLFLEPYSIYQPDLRNPRGEGGQALKSRRWSPFAEGCFAGGIFGDMLFELFAPQGLKCPAAAVQRVDFGEIRKFAQQITKSNFTGGHTCVFRHLNLNPDKPEIPKHKSQIPNKSQ